MPVYSLDDDLNTEHASHLFHLWRLLGRIAVAALVAALAICTVLIARPAHVDRDAERSSSRDIVLCLDVSGSALPYDRAVIETYLELVSHFQGERIALSIFNSTSRTVFPLTDDYNLVSSQLTKAADALRGVESQDDIDKMSDKDYQKIADWLEGTQNRKNSTSLIGDGLVSCAAMIPGFAYGDTSGAARQRPASIVLATDNVASGTPTYSLVQALDMAEASHISVDGLFSGPRQSEGDATTTEMKRQIESRGGTFLTQSGSSDINELVRQIDSRRTSESRRSSQAALIDAGMVDADAGRAACDMDDTGMEVETMRPMTFAPALGWIAGGAIAALMLAFAVAVVVVHVRRRRSSDETLTACIRRVIMFLLAAVMMLTPSIVTTTTSRAINATDVMVAVDVTGSMAVKDAEYGSSGTISRLDAAKRIVKGITSTYADSSFAALRFGASGTLDVPLTPDSIAIDGWADTLAVESTSTSAGSSLDTPLDQLMLSLKSIRDQHPDDIIVLYVITDGEQTSDTARRSYSALRRYLDDSFTIGVGSDAGGKIPMASDGTATGQQSDGQWVTDPTTGKPGISKLDEATLESIADEMGGSYLHVDASHTIEQAVSAKASRQWRLTQTVKRRERTIPVIWPFAVALGLLLAWEIGAWIAMSRRML